MIFPPSLRYSSLHTWARREVDGSITIGITDYAQFELGELQYVGLPRVGSAVRRDASFGEAESVKTVSDLHAPVAGSIVAINDAVVADPQIVNRDPYGDGWMIRLTPTAPDEFDGLQGSTAYEAQVSGAGH